jgi:cation:H+ antiporter
LAYTAATLWRARRESEKVREEFSRNLSPPSGRLGWELMQVLLGLAGLVIGGQLLVGAAIHLATGFGVSEAVIGLTIVAVGTSLPELATSVVAAARGQGDLALGNVVGSNLFNILGILGTTAVVQPLGRGNIAGWDLGAMVFLAVVLVPIARTGMVVSRIEGAFFVLFYIGYVTWLIAF